MTSTPTNCLTINSVISPKPSRHVQPPLHRQHGAGGCPARPTQIRHHCTWDRTSKRSHWNSSEKHSLDPSFLNWRSQGPRGSVTLWAGHGKSGGVKGFRMGNDQKLTHQSNTQWIHAVSGCVYHVILREWIHKHTLHPLCSHTHNANTHCLKHPSWDLRQL